ncbi:MAG: hypothetical protein K9N09_10905 [Candidatus Cloacimonetes bacterium]|nr:hypothetical protein [Candidatus Cloacimonadota bacterium]MCF7869195.1 hypothetical protein [Candidatus Cloacimonadota bacterium]
MKIILFIVTLLAITVLSAADFYGSARMAYWYNLQNKDFTGSEDRLLLDNHLMGTSRFGAKFKGDDYTGRVEFSLSRSGVKLRQIWGEYDLNYLKILVGQTYTGFFDLPAQAAPLIDGSENLMQGYGLMYDSRQSMIKFTFQNELYLIFMEPRLVDPKDLATALAIDKTEIVSALIPKVNIGYRFNFNNLMLHPTFGINMSKYNKDFTGGLDDQVLAYAIALSLKYNADKLSLLTQVSYGQNVKDYGMASPAVISSATSIDNEVENATVMGGFLELTYQLLAKKYLTGGVGYFSGDRADLDNPDTAMTGYLQAKIYLHKFMFITPEVGIIDEMEDGMGNSQGSQTYFGINFQADFEMNFK